MRDNGLDHNIMTSKQRELFKELYESGRPNTLEEHTRIAREALKAGGASDSMIDDLINASLRNLREQGVTAPTRIPCNGVQREHNKKLNNGLPILHKVPPKRDYGRYFCIMAEKGGTSHGGLTEKLSPFFHAKKQEVNAYGR